MSDSIKRNPAVHGGSINENLTLDGFYRSMAAWHRLQEEWLQQDVEHLRRQPECKRLDARLSPAEWRIRCGAQRYYRLRREFEAAAPPVESSIFRPWYSDTSIFGLRVEIDEWARHWELFYDCGPEMYRQLGVGMEVVRSADSG